MNKIKIRNIEIYVFSSRQVFLDYIKDKKRILIAINAEKILMENENLLYIINENIAYPDGMGAIMALRKKGFKAIKIPGVEFWLDIVGKFYKEKSFFLVGSSQFVIERTVAKLKGEYPSINIVGYRNGYIKDSDKKGLIAKLKDKKPDIIFVAQGSPRQEFLMDELMKIHPALYMGLGGSFDVYCGSRKRAPIVFLRLNMEWFYRLLKEPTRFKRQILLLKFFVLLKLNRL